ncbi:AAA family ATPase [Bacteroides sp. UBA939]|uniref:AAA family ATPase n=1 Tax=Bacteroides sp. UBA939 TaxID=1946092 RepID=UPI0025BD700D|nr:ATPase [Bacteroides sp. UBA939]
MGTPFIYGRIADESNFTNRKKEVELLKRNFSGLVNTIIISPRRWGKTSLVNRVAQQLLKEDRSIRICQVDIFNCRTEEEFYLAYATAVLKANHSAWDDFTATVRKYLGRLLPTVTFSDTAQTCELSFGLDFKENKMTFDEVLNLPQALSKDSGRKMIVCIDEFQNINEYDDPLAFQRKLRSHWQKHTDVCYCLYGSKRHMLLDIFHNYNMPFYKFGEILFLEKISKEDWIEFIGRKFSETGKEIREELCGLIADRMKNHPYYTQQLSQQVWFRTETVVSTEIVDEAFNDIVGQLSLLFANVIDTLTPRQINFLLAVVDGSTNFSSKEVLTKYQLGTSANIKNLKKATTEKDLIDILPGNRIVLQDPVFEYWLKHIYRIR